MKILVFGNPLIEKDFLPIKILPKLREKFPDMEFKEIDPTEGIEKEGKDLIIIDTVEGINKIITIDSIEQLQSNKLYSMHDFDLAYNLKILKKLKMVDSVKIIGIPMGIEEEKAVEEVENLLKGLDKLYSR